MARWKRRNRNRNVEAQAQDGAAANAATASRLGRGLMGEVIGEGKKKLVVFIGLCILVGLGSIAESGLLGRLIDCVENLGRGSRGQMPDRLAGVWRDDPAASPEPGIALASRDAGAVGSIAASGRERGGFRAVLRLDPVAGRGELLVNDEWFDVLIDSAEGEHWRIRLRCHAHESVVTDTGMLYRLPDNALAIEAMRKNGKRISVVFCRPSR